MRTVPVATDGICCGVLIKTRCMRSQEGQKWGICSRTSHRDLTKAILVALQYAQCNSRVPLQCPSWYAASRSQLEYPTSDQEPLQLVAVS
mmetsp:Transcript_57329/g.92742  ORF Transcript_57329/g.92742 Transcript_57329/m.92742 type:complete len:90 (+) Transcript_57329:351-620(+)